MNYPTTEQISTKLEQYARTIAPYVTLILTAVVHTYWLGYRLGRWLHSTNDLLAQHWPTRPRASTPEPLAAVITETAAVVQIDHQQLAPVADVLALHAQGLSQRAIAAQMGVSRATVRRRLATV